MTASRKVVYVDTNVIIEATRTGCWKAILNHFDVRTVTEVQREALTVPANKKSYVPIDANLFNSHVKIETVGRIEVLKASVKSPGLTALDAGERDLLAHLAGLGDDVWLVTTADRAAVRTACELKMDSRLVSLEHLAAECGQKPKVNDWFTNRWLGNVRTDFLFDSL